MNYSVIADKISKKYMIGAKQSGNMLREALVDLVRHPFHPRNAPPKIIWALNDVSFNVCEGEIVGIIGRNGAGKSTLLKVLSKITYPTSGSMKVNGRFASLLEVGTGFHDELTGRENIFLNGCIIGMTKKQIAAKFDDIVAFSDVEKFIDTPIKRYSSGMRLRLGFAVAANLDTDVLLVDEVLAVGDMGFQRKCLDKMGDLRGRGKSVLFVSHNMAAVENLCSRVLWIDNGRIREDGNTTDVIKSYMSTFSGSLNQDLGLMAIGSRQGSGEIRLTKVEYLGRNGKPLDVVRSGDGITMRFHYHAVKQVVNPSFGYKLLSEYGILVNEFGTWHANLNTGIIQPGNGYIDLDIDFLNLLPSRYYLSFWITTQDGSPYDGVENLIYLDVEVSDYYKSGRGIDRRFGYVFFPSRWNLRVP